MQALQKDLLKFSLTFSHEIKVSIMHGESWKTFDFSQ